MKRCKMCDGSGVLFDVKERVTRLCMECRSEGLTQEHASAPVVTATQRMRLEQTGEALRILCAHGNEVRDLCRVLAAVAGDCRCKTCRVKLAAVIMLAATVAPDSLIAGAHSEHMEILAILAALPEGHMECKRKSEQDKG